MDTALTERVFLVRVRRVYVHKICYYCCDYPINMLTLVEQEVQYSLQADQPKNDDRNSLPLLVG